MKLVLPVRRDRKGSKVLRVKLAPLVRRDRKGNKVHRVKLVLPVHRENKVRKVNPEWAFRKPLPSMALR